MASSFFGANPIPSIHAQLEGAVPTSSSGSTDDPATPTAIWRRRRFVAESSITRKHGRGRRSWIQREGTFVTELIGSGNTIGDTLWICRRCDNLNLPDRSFKAVATSAAIDHLRACHKITREISEGDSSSGDTEPSPKRRMLFIPRSSSVVVEELAIGFIVNSDQPFGIFTDTYMQQLLQHFNPNLYASLSWGRTAIKSRLDRIYASKKKVVMAELQAAASQIHLAFDLWTSPNRHAVLGVSAHFIDGKGHQQQRLLALRGQSGAHTGENLALSIVDVVRDWGLTNRVGTLISDNATNNDTCVLDVFQQLEPSISPADAISKRVRCYGHVLNLVGRAFLYGQDGESLEQESQAFEALDQLDNDLQLWRKVGPIGKLRNIVKWVRASPQRTESFKLIVREALAEGDDILLSEESSFETELLMNNETRWNSTYLMIARALTKQSQIQTFLSKNKQELESLRLPLEDHLTYEDWRLLVEIKDLLEPLYTQTMRTQGWAKKGSFGAMWEVLTGMEFLLTKMEDWKAFFDEPDAEDIISQSQQPRGDLRPRRGRRAPLPPALSALPEHSQHEYTGGAAQERYNNMSEDSRRYFRLSVTTGWKKLNQYYTKLSQSPLYTIAIILHPRLGIRWLERRWTSDEQLVWLRDAREGLRQYWRRWYATRPLPSTAIVKASTNSLSGGQQPSRFRGPVSFDDWLAEDEPLHGQSESLEWELDNYLALDVAALKAVDDPIVWWMSQRETSPTLAQMALDIFAIPAMAADCERAFSLAKLTLTSQRLSMDIGTMEKSQSLKNWGQRGAITLGTGSGSAPRCPAAQGHPLDDEDTGDAGEGPD